MKSCVGRAGRGPRGTMRPAPRRKASGRRGFIRRASGAKRSMESFDTLTFAVMRRGARAVEWTGFEIQFPVFA